MIDVLINTSHMISTLVIANDITSFEDFLW
jgi:hypothetical protein